MALTQELIDQVTQYAGRFNTDVLLGWEAGQQGRQRIGNLLVERSPPEHFSGNRYTDWLVGYEAANRHKTGSPKTTRFVGKGHEGQMVVVRKGWIARAARAKVITQMQKDGAYGEVDVFYLEGSDIKRTVNCLL
jgi:hypothetical protein